ncbi:beta-ketoacyl-ACP synthase [Gilvimarinus sp. SDUM040013]|uniref:Beta-ketoacyl-ACP synthase n=1 Tax=Gilvimarinus gilvus TaxID=3058038 RepID=A0ABU4S3I5_9GAMM|nr:beta-ketoacyl-ACP synthase [Gilvimarinus sp. SDUM040013]MDO3387785.1 beta-ketoacyl-ACP synthase [Gilvimarinus sp. SDUM040013]MDX6851072.1 beta-ketoacyl-ACP synthase [Gilvimarinus sp. SDUM040013]
MSQACYLTDLGLVNALGGDGTGVSRALFSGHRGLVSCDWVPGKATYVAPVAAHLAPVPERLAAYGSRNAGLALTAVDQLSDTIGELKTRYQSSRIAVVAGSSTSGIAEGERAVASYSQSGVTPPDYAYRAQEIGNLAELVAAYCELDGLAYTLSTACSSSAHALASAKRLLDTGMADAVIAGGADSLCRLTVNGFAALDSVSDTMCSPFSTNRRGINIGEAAAFFVVSKEPLRHRIQLLGAGASSDAHHISAPDPEGAGAEAAISMALAEAGLRREDIGYVNLHGTGTPLNDAMESAVISRLFPHQPQVSSSKGQIGHTLGAAGATEAGLMWLALTGGSGKLPPHCYDGHYDPALPQLNLVNTGDCLAASGQPVFLSNSFAFGGNNAALIIGLADDA